MTAFEVIAVALLGLGLAVLLNADALVADAQRLPFGAHRDRSLAVWEPVADASGVLQLTRLRAGIDEAFDRRGTRAVEPATPIVELPAVSTTQPPPSATSVAPTAPDLRTPTPESPLVMWVGGDSLIQELGTAVVRKAEGSGLFSASLDYRISTGLTRPDYFDWPDHLTTELDTLDPEVVVIMFGANDAQGIQAPDGQIYQFDDDGWGREYRRRVATMMDLLVTSRARVYWVAQPPMRDAGFDARMRRLNRIYAAEAATRPLITFIDSGAVLGDSDGDFQDLATIDGETLDLRQADGIHLGLDGADLLGDAILEIIREDARLPPD